MQQNTDPTKRASDQKPALSETISNAHGSGDGSLRLGEDGLIEPTGDAPEMDSSTGGETPAPPEAY